MHFRSEKYTKIRFSDRFLQDGGDREVQSGEVGRDRSFPLDALRRPLAARLMLSQMLYILKVLYSLIF